MSTPLHVALNELPMAHFSKLIELQRKNGAKCVQGKNTAASCAVHLDILSDVLCDDIKRIIKAAPFFSIEFDGSQARKTQTNRELIYMQIVVSVLLL